MRVHQRAKTAQPAPPALPPSAVDWANHLLHRRQRQPPGVRLTAVQDRGPQPLMRPGAAAEAPTLTHSPHNHRIFPVHRFVCVKQTGSWRNSTGSAPGSAGGWKRVTADQYYSTTEPGYVWAATVELAPLLWIRGWESYLRGTGSQHWKLCSLLTVQDTRGRHVDRCAAPTHGGWAV